MIHARAALTQAFQVLSEEHPAVFSNLEVRLIFRVVLLVVSHEDQPAKTWDDVRGVVAEAVDAHLSEQMRPIQPAIVKVLLDVVDSAVRIAPVFVTPPPY